MTSKGAAPRSASAAPSPITSPRTSVTLVSPRVKTFSSACALHELCEKVPVKPQPRRYERAPVRTPVSAQ